MFFVDLSFLCTFQIPFCTFLFNLPLQYTFQISFQNPFTVPFRVALFEIPFQLPCWIPLSIQVFAARHPLALTSDKA